MELNYECNFEVCSKIIIMKTNRIYWEKIDKKIVERREKKIEWKNIQYEIGQIR